MSAPTIVEALSDPQLLGASFGDPSSWRAWRVALKSLFGLSMTPGELEVYRKHTTRSIAPTEPAREAWFVVGRRGGKSRIAAMIGVHLACFRDYGKILAPGERGTLMVIAADRRQARTVFRYIDGFLESSPLLGSMVEKRTKESIALSNRVTIEVHTASFRAVRGYTLVGAVLDEISFWRTDEAAAEPDAEIVAAIRPAMATVPGSLLLAISSPYARRGALWQAYADHFGKDGDPVLVWQADTRSMNPGVPEQIIERALQEDEPSARAEYLAEFRRDIETFVGREAVEACTVPGRLELPPASGVRYSAFVDPSGGSQDSMTLAIAHHEGGRAVLDLVREVRPPFSPEAVVSEFAALLKQYRLSTVTGDRYGGEWPREQFRRQGVSYEPSEWAKSDLYAALLPLLNSGRVELPEHRRLLSQLLALERRTSRGGRDSIDHGPRGHDDLVNAAAGALVIAAQPGVTLGFPSPARVEPRWRTGSWWSGR